jgi:DeoR/GlpR family transcriptional regulator of sugar metabolism
MHPADTLPINDRRWAIVQEIQHTQRVTVADLSQAFGVSAVSIRRDLAYLERAGLLQRTHGGAQAVSRGGGQILPVDARLLQNAEVKRAIGQAAAGLIRPGDTVLLDTGTTVLEVARHIPPALLEGGSLTVITRSLLIAALLRNQRRTRLLVLGGVYVHDFDTFVGPQVEDALRGIHVDTLFIGIDGVSATHGLTTDNVLEAALYPALVRCAGRVVVVADSSKIGVHRLQTIISLDEIHSFITDAGVPADFVRLLQEKGIEVTLCPSKSASSAPAAARFR